MQVKEDIFIEPSTGCQIPVTHPSYHRVEAIWNSENFWASLQYHEKGAIYDFDLENAKLWLPFRDLNSTGGFAFFPFVLRGLDQNLTYSLFPPHHELVDVYFLLFALYNFSYIFHFTCKFETNAK